MALELDPDHVPRIKLILHCLQIAFSTVAWCLAIAVFAGKDAKVVGNNGWTFGVCFLSIPAWVYLIMTPRFSRTRKFANPYAMLAVDAVFTVIWLSAFATQAAYNSSGLCGKACNLSKAVVGLGVFVTLLFGGSTFISAYTMQYYKFHGSLPGYDNHKIRNGDNSIDPDKAAFSMAPHDEEAYERVNPEDHEGGSGGAYSDSGRYGHANPYSADDDDPNRYGAFPPRQDDLFNQDTAYGSGGGAGVPNPSTSPNPYGAHGGSHVSYNDEPAQFPAANYDRVQS